jgi:CheY-like chemotaxis protein
VPNEPPAAGGPVARTPGAIFVVGTRPVVGSLVARACEGRPWLHVVQSPSLEDASRRAADEPPSLLVVDVVASGLEACREIARLQEQPGFRDVPVVMMAVSEDTRRGVALNAAHFLSKPVSREQLVDVVAPYRRAGGGDLLVVDDDPSMRDLLRRYLAPDGWRVRDADGGEAALARMRDAVPDVVLLDLVMPTMDGFELLAALRREPAWRDVPVVVVTAKSLPDADRISMERFAERLLGDAAPPSHELLGHLATIVGAAGVRLTEGESARA